MCTRAMTDINNLPVTLILNFISVLQQCRNNRYKCYKTWYVKPAVCIRRIWRNSYAAQCRVIRHILYTLPFGEIIKRAFGPITAVSRCLVRLNIFTMADKWDILFIYLFHFIIGIKFQKPLKSLHTR